MSVTTNIKPGSTVVSIHNRSYTVRERKPENETAPENSVPILVNIGTDFEVAGYIWPENIQSVEPAPEPVVSLSDDSATDFNEDLAEFAIEHRAALTFIYTKPNGDITSRSIVPDDILATNGGHKLILGEDEVTGEIRTFRLDRIEGRAGLAANSWSA